MSILEILISQTKVGNFANKVVIKKNITSRQVTMDYLQKDITVTFSNFPFSKKKKQFQEANTLLIIFETGVREFKPSILNRSVVYCNPGIGEELNSKGITKANINMFNS